MLRAKYFVMYIFLSMITFVQLVMFLFSWKKYVGTETTLKLNICKTN